MGLLRRRGGRVRPCTFSRRPRTMGSGRPGLARRAIQQDPPACTPPASRRPATRSPRQPAGREGARPSHRGGTACSRSPVRVTRSTTWPSRSCTNWIDTARLRLDAIEPRAGRRGPTSFFRGSYRDGQSMTNGGRARGARCRDCHRCAAAVCSLLCSNGEQIDFSCWSPGAARSALSSPSCPLCALLPHGKLRTICGAAGPGRADVAASHARAGSALFRFEHPIRVGDAAPQPAESCIASARIEASPAASSSSGSRTTQIRRREARGRRGGEHRVREGGQRLAPSRRLLPRPDARRPPSAGAAAFHGSRAALPTSAFSTADLDRLRPRRRGARTGPSGTTLSHGPLIVLFMLQPHPRIAIRPTARASSLSVHGLDVLRRGRHRQPGCRRQAGRRRSAGRIARNGRGAGGGDGRSLVERPGQR